jgi:hypothetical protein
VFKGKEEYDFVSKEDCQYLIDYVIKSNAWSFSEDAFWNNRVFYPELLPDNNELKIKMSSILKKTKSFIAKEYNLENVYADTFHIVRWFDGQFQPPHQDNMENVMYGVDFFKHRSYGSIIYLNDNFEGGETFYPQYDIAIAPKSGKLAVHLGDGDHLHSVNEIKNGTRYTIAAFWGTEKKYDNEY